MKPAVAAALMVALAAPHGAASQRPSPRWAAVEGITLGGPLDDVVAKNGECRPADASGDLSPGVSTSMFVQAAFRYALPHQHEPRDSAALRAALRLATLCRVGLFDGRAWMLAAAIDRRVVAMVVWFDASRPDRLDTDSVRRRVYVAWGRPTHPAPTLDTWWSARYRSYLLIPGGLMVPQEFRIPQLIVVDVAECTAFDRRAHRAGARGEAGAC